jgi:hypothetical protein
MIYFFIDHIIDIFEILLPTLLIQFKHLSKKSQNFYKIHKESINILIFIVLFCRTLYKYAILDLKIEEVDLLIKIITSGINIVYLTCKLIK